MPGRRVSNRAKEPPKPTTKIICLTVQGTTQNHPRVKRSWQAKQQFSHMYKKCEIRLKSLRSMSFRERRLTALYCRCLSKSIKERCYPKGWVLCTGRITVIRSISNRFTLETSTQMLFHLGWTSANQPKASSWLGLVAQPTLLSNWSKKFQTLC